MSHHLSIYVIFMSVVFGLALSSCGSSKTVTAVRGSGGKDSSSRPVSVSNLDPMAKILIKEAESWIGTPYRYGGNDRGGVDCSGFVTQVYKRALDIKLPRTSREQSEFCQKINKSNLTPGDLVFFRTTRGSNRVSHVGIFVGDNQMIHSSTSKGVIYTDITSDYYMKTFAGAGKVGPYHAMLSKETKSEEPAKSEKKNRKPKENTESDKSSEDKHDDIHISPVESPAGYTLTPVSSIPTRTTTVQTTSATEPTPDDARAAVLNSLVEKEF